MVVAAMSSSRSYVILTGPPTADASMAPLRICSQLSIRNSSPKPGSGWVIVRSITAPLSPDGEIARHVQEHGDGVHDIAFAVDDVADLDEVATLIHPHRVPRRCIDVVAVHLVGGVLGSLMVGLFADDAVNELATDGLFLGGGASLLTEQFIAVAATFVFSFVVSYVIGIALKAVLPKGIRVTEEEEHTGLDLTQHSETG